ncbi:MAG TPA: SusC/RagA family TonB-linked outer membrane protein [Gemmatimonadales bacterium]|nr:SusC/RagA family TonB-linked outer membrane protein [Gemmatimonadales bacterium]
MLLDAAALTLALLVPFSTRAVAQQATQVAGQVQDSSTGRPVSDVRVSVVGTVVGTVTGADGRYTLTVPAGRDSLSFRHIGYRVVKRAVAPVVDVALRAQAIELEHLEVTTALGITREAGTLTSAAQNVSGDQLSNVPTTNVLSALQGNVAGLQVTNATNPFGSARVISRGATSILGQNQPLIVVDGIPIDNSAASNIGYGPGSGTSMGGYDVGNAASDLDANNVQLATVLKGPNAAALYGSRAANGAILYTTKSGRDAPGGGFGVTITVGSTFETPLRLPDYQNQYGQGFYGEFDFVDGNFGGKNDGADESWGPKLDGRTTGCVMVAGTPFGTSNYDASKPCHQFFGVGPWAAHPNNVRDFWNTGAVINANVSVAKAGERSNVRLSVGRVGESGMYPNNTNTRTDVSLAGGTQMSDRWSAEASFNYINDALKNQPAQAYEEIDPMQGFIWFGRQVDTRILKDNIYRNPNDPLTQQILAGNANLRTDAPIPYSWNYSYHPSVYWMADVKKTDFTRNRGIGHVSLTYKVNDWLNITGRTGRDWYQNHFRANYPVNDISPYPGGGLNDVAETRSESNSDFLATATHPLLKDLNVTVNVGGNARVNDFQRDSSNVPQLVIPGVYTISNSAGSPDVGILQQKKKVNSLYGSASFNYKSWLTVDVTGRNDWSSTLPRGANSFFYPSVGAAFIFTDALQVQSDVLSYGKVRASWTRVGNDTDPYQLAAVYSAGTKWGGQPSFTAPDRLPNPALKPEQTTGEEIGADLGLLNNRVSLNATVYQKSSTNQILPVSISAATGYTQAVVNSGNVRNRGIELTTTFRPIEKPDFRWDVTANWSKNSNTVLSLYGGVQRVVVGSYWNVNVTADSGQPYGNLVGTKWMRDPQGHIVVDSASGLPIRDSKQTVLGNYNPDWVGGITNTFNYKNFSLSFTLDGQMGGNVYSVTKWFGDYSGVLQATLLGREKEWNDRLVVPNAVYQNSAGAFVPDTVHVLAQDYWHNTFYAQEMGIIDATYMKLRELRLAYQLPPSVAQHLGFSQATVALVGRNLLLWAKNPTIDPETTFDTGNRQGVENGQLPTARSIGFTVNVRP